MGKYKNKITNMSAAPDVSDVPTAPDVPDVSDVPDVPDVPDVKKAGREKKDIKIQYDEYVSNMTKNQMGDKIKPYEKWIRIDEKGEHAGESGETKNQKFERLAKSRMTSILQSFETLDNLSGNAYESTKEQKEKIISTLKIKVVELENSFAQTKESKKDIVFEF